MRGKVDQPEMYWVEGGRGVGGGRESGDLRAIGGITDVYISVFSVSLGTCLDYKQGNKQWVAGIPVDRKEQAGLCLRKFETADCEYGGEVEKE